MQVALSLIWVLYLTCGGTRIPVDLFMAHPLDVGFSSASDSGFSVEPFALHYSVPLGDDGVGHHLENVCVLVL